MTALLVVLLLIVLLLIRVPVAFAIIASGFVGLLILDPHTVDGIMQVVPASSVQSLALSAIPLFMLMAQLILMSGLIDSLFDAARAVMGRGRGSTGVSSVAAGVAFAAVSGSSTASAATLAKTTVSRMVSEGYRPSSAAGLVSSVGTLAGMIPPSIVLIFYAITAEQSVGDLLIAGIIPGLVIAVALVAVMFSSMLNDSNSVPAGKKVAWRDKVRMGVPALPVLVLFGAVIGSIYFGVATATEAAAIGCLAALVLVVVRKKFSVAGFVQALIDTVKSSAMIFTIIIGATIFGHFITESRVTGRIVTWIEGLAVPALLVMFVIMIGYLVLGFFMDQTAIIALTVPVMLPVIEALGYNAIWFGIFIVLMGEIGLITPPLGLNVFVVARTAGRDVTEVFRGAVPYAAGMLCVATMFLLWPEIVLWLPGQMG
ncbi:TRAP transporter large permease [Rhodococcus sp. IEGM 1366]|uniref:TRAP transporter large permease n=1 Tax=Rhodococcus sp. IEGM 1366 TaxID=3082223 RepID=UPI0029535F43|nr:TRAP transporter large permease [Rhodococcus sp. IEGM 1366]MDV8070924.1 TRAP transporter large permease [Rhodococcus sp. IEGM 1366]